MGLETAGDLLHSIVGHEAAHLWAIALLASGQSSTITGACAVVEEVAGAGGAVQEVAVMM